MFELRNSKFGAIKHGPQKILFISPFLTFLIEKKISSPKKVSKEVFGDNFLKCRFGDFPSECFISLVNLPLPLFIKEG